MFEHSEFYGTPENRMKGIHLYGVHHEVYLSFKTSLKMSYKDILCWLNQHDYGDDVTMLRDACEYLVMEGAYYGSLEGSLGAMLLKHYTLEELTQMWALYGIEVRRNPYSHGLWIETTVTSPKTNIVEGADEDLPF